MSENTQVCPGAEVCDLSIAQELCYVDHTTTVVLNMLYPSSVTPLKIWCWDSTEPSGQVCTDLKTKYKNKYLEKKACDI